MKENNILRCWGCLFPLNLIEVFTLHLLLKLPWSHEVALHVCKSTISSSMEHCCNIRAGVHRYYSDMLDKMQKWVCRTVGFSLASFLESMSHGWNVANKAFSIGIALLDIHLNWLDWVQLLIGDLLVHSVKTGYWLGTGFLKKHSALLIINKTIEILHYAPNSPSQIYTKCR